MAQVRTFVALDVHVSATVAAVIDSESGELRRQRLSGQTSEVAEFVAGLEGPVRATYEAGPTGFALARRLQAAGVDCLVARRGDSAWARRSREDRPARRRAPGAAVDGRRAAPRRGPGVEAEGLRDLVRAREDLRGELMSARHRVRKLLLRHDVRFEGPERNWTQPHLRVAGDVRFDAARHPGRLRGLPRRGRSAADPPRGARAPDRRAAARSRPGRRPPGG